VSTQKLIIYQLRSLYHILEELCLDLNFKVVLVGNENSLNNEIKNSNNYLIIQKKIILNIDNQFILDNTPINIFQLIEKINIEFLKIQFNSQSKLKINNYSIDLNSRELLMKNIKLKLTEKEINTIIYLSKSEKPVSVEELQEKVWSYHSDMETHTVETHIYRLRKKIFNTFNDSQFIFSQKNGYQIK
jgi:nitrogenase molybdenum-iron protein alpha/beta subunit